MRKLYIDQVPSSVYRIQLSEHFTIVDATKLLPYIAKLGCEGVYCSPYFEALSDHGYDITNPSCFNTILGKEEDFQDFYASLKQFNLYHILDLVPNHMGIKKGKNPWWQDVCENGPFSNYAHFFDIQWNPPYLDLKDQIFLPILPSEIKNCLKDIQVYMGPEGLYLEVYDHKLPLCPESYHLVLNETTQPQKEFYAHFDRKKDTLEHQVQKKQISPDDKVKVDLTEERLLNLLKQQFYVLAFWKQANHYLNYRRFFNINDLPALKIENPEVFKQHHKKVFALIADQKVQGLRIDHPDGLKYPEQYFASLAKNVNVYTIIEKVLHPGEQLPEWKVDGTVGYDFLNISNGVFVNTKAETLFSKVYEDFIDREYSFSQVLLNSKKEFITSNLSSATSDLGARLSECLYPYPLSSSEAQNLVTEVLCHFPIYRTYLTPEKQRKKDRLYLKNAFSKATSDHNLEKTIHALIDRPDPKAADFFLRLQQLCSPVMAKALEDKTCYLYNRLLSLNEVGSDPSHFGYELGNFHAFNQNKFQKWPLSILSVMTHDTKRSSDVRMRLNVLSEIPSTFNQWLNQWRLMTNAESKKYAIDANDQYFIFQTLLGIWNTEDLSFDRVWPLILKSLREGGEETNWVHPKIEYETSIQKYLQQTFFNPNHQVQESLTKCAKVIDTCGRLNSLSLSVLMLCSPGVVDVYQNNETYQYTLVDPDNRRPVLTEVKMAQLEKLEDIKLKIHHQLLTHRRKHKALYLKGNYIPLLFPGKKGKHLVGFIRQYQNEALLVITCRFFTHFYEHGSLDLSSLDLLVPLPSSLKHLDWDDLLNGNHYDQVNRILVSNLLQNQPVSVLYGKC